VAQPLPLVFELEIVGLEIGRCEVRVEKVPAAAFLPRLQVEAGRAFPAAVPPSTPFVVLSHQRYQFVESSRPWPGNPGQTQGAVAGWANIEV